MVQGKTVKKTRLKDIAEATGYSLMTVSLALNPRPNGIQVAEATRKKIEEVARKMNYTPNMTARTLSGGRSNVVGVMFNSVRDSFFSELLLQIESALHSRGYTGFYTFWGSQEEFERSLRLMHQYNVCGILTGHDAEADYPDVPVICYGSSHRTIESIYPPEAGMIKTAVEYAVKQGYTKLGYAGFSNTKKRAEAFRDELAQRGLTPVFISDTTTYREPHLEEIDRLMANPRRPEVMIFSNDQIAVEWIAELQSRGWSLPQDMCCISINNLTQCMNVTPRLTSVDFRFHQLGNLLLERLLRRCENPDLPREDIVLPLSIAERNSCPKSRFQK